MSSDSIPDMAPRVLGDGETIEINGMRFSGPCHIEVKDGTIIHNGLPRSTLARGGGIKVTQVIRGTIKGDCTVSIGNLDYSGKK